MEVKGIKWCIALCVCVCVLACAHTYIDNFFFYLMSLNLVKQKEKVKMLFYLNILYVSLQYLLFSYKKDCKNHLVRYQYFVSIIWILLRHTKYPLFRDVRVYCTTSGICPCQFYCA